MKTTPLGAFPGYQPCDKLDPQWVDAYVELRLDPENPAGIILDTSWGETFLDLTSVIRSGETVTHLDLAPENNPTVLRYKNEAGDYECIPGDDLSRIISMQYLKDVDQSIPPSDGIVYMYDGQSSAFEPYDLKTFVGDTNIHLGRLDTSVTSLQNQVNALGDRVSTLEGKVSTLEGKVSTLENKVSTLETTVANHGNRIATLEGTVADQGNRLAAIENAIFNWAGDKNTKIARGNINVYGDNGNTDSHSHGIFTHDQNTNVNDDLYFA